jgi:hypothetical protein
LWLVHRRDQILVVERRLDESEPPEARGLDRPVDRGLVGEMGDLEFVMGDLVNVGESRPYVVLNSGGLRRFNSGPALSDLVHVGSGEGIGVGEHAIGAVQSGSQCLRLVEIRGSYLVCQAHCLAGVARERPHPELPSLPQRPNYTSSLGSGRSNDSNDLGG